MSDLFARIEPRTRSEDLSPGLAAKVHDPAWILARQMVFGEFQGEHGGTPIIAAFKGEVHSLSSLVLPGGEVIGCDSAAAPLDMLVEAAPVRARAGWTARLRIAAGRELLRQLVEHGLGEMTAAVVAAYSISRPGPELGRRDPTGARLLAVAAGRLPDGEQLRADDGEQTLSRVETPPGKQERLTEALMAWWRWLGETRNEPPSEASAWVPERLEHRFTLRSASFDQEFRAEAHRGGDLDWCSFEAAPGPVPTEQAAPLEGKGIPTPVRFRGMPRPRLFEFEDGGVDLGSVQAAPSDLAKMALLEYAFAFGNDVFSLPLRLALGTFTRIQELRVTDSFGIETIVPPALRAPSGPGAANGLGFFVLTTTDGGRVPGLLLPQVAKQVIVGPALEEAKIVRDEMANIVWAVEARVEGGDGIALARAEQEARSAPLPPPPSSDPALTYRLQSVVPPSWFPLVLLPPEEQDGRRMLRLETLGPSVEAPRGQLLPPLGRTIHEEEVPREGVRLVREAVLCRWIDGSTRLWARRRRGTGRGEGSSGLRFDFTEPMGAAIE